MFCIIAYLALVKLMFSFFSFHYLTFISHPKLPGGFARTAHHFLSWNPAASRFSLVSLGKNLYYNKKKNVCFKLSLALTLKSTFARVVFYPFFSGFHYKSKKSWSTCFLNVFFSQLYWRFFIVRSCVCVSPLLMLFVCNYFLRITFQYKKLKTS